MYFITSVYPEKDGFGTRCVGYLASLEKTIEAVEENCCDLYEAGAYPYVVVEHLEEGFYQYDFNPMWFKYNKSTDKYDRIYTKPDFVGDNLIGFAIG